MYSKTHLCCYTVYYNVANAIFDVVCCILTIIESEISLREKAIEFFLPFRRWQVSDVTTTITKYHNPHCESDNDNNNDNDDDGSSGTRPSSARKRLVVT